MSKFLIYSLVDPNTNEIRYIGKSTTGMIRPKRHLNPHSLKAKTYKNNWINSLLKNGQTYTVDILETFDSALPLDEREEYWINHHFSIGTPLTNSTSGGKGAQGRILSEDSKKLMSKKRTEFHKKHPEVIKEVGIKQRKPHVFIDGIEHKHCCDCDQYLNLDSFSGNLKAWDKLTAICKECAKSRIREIREEFPPETLSDEEWEQSYIDRKEAMAAGVKKRFETDPTYKEKLRKARSKAIVRTCLNTGEVKVYSSALEAKKDGFQNSNIGQAIKYNRPYKGFTWNFQ